MAGRGDQPSWGVRPASTPCVQASWVLFPSSGSGSEQSGFLVSRASEKSSFSMCQLLSWAPGYPTSENFLLENGEGRNYVNQNFSFQNERLFLDLFSISIHCNAIVFYTSISYLSARFHTPQWQGKYTCAAASFLQKVRQRVAGFINLPNI